MSIRIPFSVAKLIACALVACNVAAADENDALTLSAHSRPVATYIRSFAQSPDPAAPWYGRSGFIHPVHTPGGRIVTDDFPLDHLHQHGVMFAWTSARVAGRPVDFWNSRLQQGRVEHVKTLEASPDRLVVELQHVDDGAEEPNVVLRERWLLNRVAHPTMHVFDLTSTQSCVGEESLDIAEYHYGGLCVRGAKDWSDGVDMLTSEGHNRSDGNHTDARWVAMSGKVDGARCGIAAMGHPANFRAPQPVRLHPSMPYFCFAPMIGGSFSIEPDKPYVSRFRFAAFDGPVDADELEQLWRIFSKTEQLR